MSWKNPKSQDDSNGLRPWVAAIALALLMLPGAVLLAETSAEGEDDRGLPGEELCYPAEPYQGINAVPPITMQITPSTGGDTVTNDALYPPGPEPRVVVGFWEQPDPDYEPAEGEHPCQGEPTMKIAYPISYVEEMCYGWKHWHMASGELGMNPNSAREFACTDGVFSYNQWTSMDCTPEGPVGEEGTPKKAYPDRCCRDNPPTIYSQILSGCGKAPPVHPRP